MNTQFANGLMQLIPGFCGTFPCDMIPRPKPFTSFIVNTDTSAFGGEHWVAVYITRRNFYFFDSFGRTIGQFPDPFKSYMKQASKNFNVRTSSRLLQSYKSDTCGFWAVFFLYCKHANYTLMFKQFTNDRERNEMMLYYFMKFELKLMPDFMQGFKLTQKQKIKLLELRLNIVN